MTIDSSNNAKIVLQGSTDPYIRWREGSTDKAYIQWHSSGKLILSNQESGERLDIGSGSTGLQYLIDGSGNTVWHAGNDGSGSGLDADTVDGIEGASLLRSDANDTISAMYTGHASNTEIFRLRSSNYSSNYLYIGGWSTSNSNNISRIRTSGNLHIDAPANGLLYLNHYSNTNIRLKLDGQEGSYYRNASNINAGTLSSSRIPTLSQYVLADSFDTLSGTYDFTSTAGSVIDFTGTGSNNARGIYFNGKVALSAVGNGSDNWIRLNQNNSFTAGVYTPGTFRVDGFIHFAAGSGASPSLAFNGDKDTGIYRRSSNNIGYATGGVARYGMSGNAFFPNQNNADDLGTSSLKWDDVRATNNVIQTSDRTKKNTITTSDLGLDFINKLLPVSYKLNENNGYTSSAGSRTHYGLIAQDIETLLGTLGKTGVDFAGFCKDTVTEDVDGNKVEPAEIEYGLRYTEFISPIIKAIQELAEKVAALEAKS